MPRGFIIAATASGSGKTTLALGIMAALVRRGIDVAPFKVGPDFIDPGHHGQVTGRTSCNLDGWMMPRTANERLFREHAGEGRFAVVEGVMGLFDGYDGRSEAGSTAQMAKWLKLPVLLVVDARSMARSAAAVVQGFERFDPEVAFAGVVFNRIGSPRHLQYLREALDAHVSMPCLGGIPRADEIRLPERHLGLITADERPLDAGWQDRLADLIEAHLDLEALLDAQEPIDPERRKRPPEKRPAGDGPRIGIARDRAFCFYYPENLALLERFGARLVYFSPLSDTAPPDGLDGLYLGGGYPEMAAGRLAANHGMRDAIRTLSREGLPIYAECGGFMYLGRRLIDGDGRAHDMAGCFPHTTRMLSRRKALGYRQIETTAESVLGAAGTRARGHEFHYSEVDADGATAGLQTIYRVASRAGDPMFAEGYCRRATLGSYIHLHFLSNPELARGFVRSCRRFKMNKDVRHETI